ncbi:hypothetical protein QJV38_12535 [Listeria cossartiae subsp. cayugensis]|uniref:Uncharacterized protein n=1 Tax=Listeria cossartiae subsp. cayugensis TaxID=2713505 RepID=A0ABU2IQL6_9LIST|nr:hypothetical protein [Listeria cossartiae]MDT0050658.1 hypothetical protein [Listeria cossartiae subsp. cayugensis]MDT0067160.1 hypothetical protein [Listeria cossartiae subsp. cayugensis]MDT0080855.1 hypothetical protein [Listeria cossartiae subsp. cayugensis]MDT0083520.1 hypothetical protein [Listeria cossartiae subsp. cayugensis]MDT0089393.1 hypothetical protein [Listeria cossartiae subsp. cayugensis]
MKILKGEFFCMCIWDVICFASNGRMGLRVFDRWWMDFDGGALFV